MRWQIKNGRLEIADTPANRHNFATSAREKACGCVGLDSGSSSGYTVVGAGSAGAEDTSGVDDAGRSGAPFILVADEDPERLELDDGV